ncbi:hypothetical protein D7B12_14170 [Salmonella enterica]|nr:hypothetical protein [Salmonella enterica]
MKNIQYIRYGTIHKYSTIHLIHTIQLIHTVRTVHTLSLFFRSDPKKGRVGSPRTAPARSDPVTQDVAAQSADVATRCCVRTLPCDPARRGRKDRCGYSLTVLHFRKVVNGQKIGSAEKHRQVI